MTQHARFGGQFLDQYGQFRSERVARAGANVDAAVGLEEVRTKKSISHVSFSTSKAMPYGR